jgi:hypothetical protein
MTIDYTQIAIWGLSVCMALVGWFCRQIWQALEDIRSEASKLRESLPKEYVAMSRMDILFDKLDNKMDRVLDKLDMKADK